MLEKAGQIAGADVLTPEEAIKDGYALPDAQRPNRPPLHAAADFLQFDDLWSVGGERFELLFQRLDRMIAGQGFSRGESR